MALQYAYVRERYRFNQPYNFFLRNEVLVNYPPVKKDKKNFIIKEMADRSTENATQFAVAEVNTDRAEYVSSSMFHIEGGWPKDIDTTEEEQTIRYTKKLQRSEDYRVQMNRNLDSMKKAVMQNAGVNVYENYFDKFDSANVLQCYSYADVETKSSASKISFSAEETPKLAVAYSQSIFALQEENVTCPLVWDFHNAESPYIKLNTNSSCSTLEYNMKCSNAIAGGLQNGQVCVWDIRETSEPQIISNIGNSHNSCVTTVCWSLKDIYQIASGSSNGYVYLWDIRKINEPVNNLKINSITTDEENPIDVSCTVLEFDKIDPRQLYIGTGDGRLIFVKNDSTNLEKMYEMKCHNAPVTTLEHTQKSVLTVDSCDIKMWSTTWKSEPLFSKSSIEDEFSCGVWSRTRYSRFFIGKLDGSIDFWDLTYHHTEPYFSLKPASGCVKDIQTHNYGKLMACSYDNGDVYLIELADKFVGPITDLLEHDNYLEIESFGRKAAALEPDTDLEPNTDADLEPNADADLEPNADADLEPNADADLEPNADASLEPNADASLEPNADSSLEADLKPE